MEIPIVNKTKRDWLLGLEPEGDTIPLPAGHKLTLLVDGAERVEIDVEDDVLSISVMCEKQVWSGNQRIR